MLEESGKAEAPVPSVQREQREESPAATVDVWIDFVCPYCFLAEQPLAAAIQGLNARVEWMPFELRPSIHRPRCGPRASTCKPHGDAPFTRWRRAWVWTSVCRTSHRSRTRDSPSKGCSSPRNTARPPGPRPCAAHRREECDDMFRLKSGGRDR